MLKIGITGQRGFIGGHLYQTLCLFPDEFFPVEFHPGFFQDEKALQKFAGQCDVIVHLAAVNRHDSDEKLYETNMRLVEKLITALKKSGGRAHILFASSTQEDRDNGYGKSKKEGRRMLRDWAKSAGVPFTGMIIPNVFGPFGKPGYNSFIATFCHDLIHGVQPHIERDAEIRLIYVGELVDLMLEEIRKRKDRPVYVIPHSSEQKVSVVLRLLNDFRKTYLEEGSIPRMENRFEINLFNTFRSFLDPAAHFPVKYKTHRDGRGTFTELARLHTGGQISFSLTVPEAQRGGHFHTRKIERFAVIKGEALIRMRRLGTEEILAFALNGNESAFVDIPVWYTHDITNTGKEDLYTVFWINEWYDPEDPDTFLMKVG